ncbi:putative bifunctional diguanylate cyclase/phosphodiesterase [Limoniibacter endophyticus]|nr:EAL domain-containing protein [Limoniibacter endophyticus]
MLLTEFDDVKLLLYRWQRAIPVGEPLPRYEDLALGNIGRFADEIAIVHHDDGASRITRAGNRFNAVSGWQCAGRTLDDLPAPQAQAIRAAMAASRRTQTPQLALYRAVLDGLVSTIEIISLPMSCRWKGDFFLIFQRPRANAINLARLLINAAHQGIIALSPTHASGDRRQDFLVLSINEGAANLLGERADDLQNVRLSRILAKHRLRRLLSLARRQYLRNPSSPFEVDYRLGTKTISLHVSIANADGIYAVTLTSIDELRARETLFRSMFDDNPVPMYLRERSGQRFLNFNAAALRLYGWNREDIVGRQYGDLCASGTDEVVFGETSKRHRTLRGGELEVIEYNREIMVDDTPAILSTIVDMTERKKSEAHITYLAHHDPLTGAANRNYFTQELEAAVERASRGDENFAVILFDLDNFKLVNDTLGHAAGDQLLKEVTRRIKKLVRKSDIVARLGGDEFAVLLPGMSSHKQTSQLSARILQQIESISEIEGAPISISASIGAAIAPIDATDGDALIRAADLALYRVKHDTKGGFLHFKEEMDASVKAKRTLEAELRNAQPDEQFELHYQPILAVKSGYLRGFEALMRWNHPRIGRVSPADFIPLAEETGKILELGAWALRAACMEAASWPGDLVVAVNVSAVQFRNGGLEAALTQALSDSNLPPHRLEIEITESILLEQTDATISMLENIRALGIRVALDDFGTGFASMSYLRHFPFSRLKIDRSFIQEIAESQQALAIVRAIINLGNSLGIDTTAEGVETDAQLIALQAEECGELQGYLFSPPVNQAALSQIISTYLQPVQCDQARLEQVA